jgi:hypothetical protein
MVYRSRIREDERGRTWLEGDLCRIEDISEVVLRVYVLGRAEAGKCEP